MNEFLGRAFELSNGTIVLPCEFCGNPAFEPEKHTCQGLMDAVLETLEKL